MNNFQIERLMKQHLTSRRVFAGVLPSDMLPVAARSQRPCAYIINLDRHDLPGSHWTAAFFPRTEYQAEYFDSYGRPPVDVIHSFMERHGKYRSSTVVLQNLFSTVCAQYCIYFVMQRLNDRSMSSIIKELERMTPPVSDEFVNRYVERTFGQNLSVYDTGFLLSQIATPFEEQPVDVTRWVD